MITVEADHIRKSELDVVTEERLEAAIVVVARAIAETGEANWVPLLERLESELKKMKDARDGVTRARQIIADHKGKGKAIF
jgi:hypothetical protein